MAAVTKGVGLDQAMSTASNETHLASAGLLDGNTDVSQLAQLSLRLAQRQITLRQLLCQFCTTLISMLQLGPQSLHT
jgi:hypothetical protein